MHKDQIAKNVQSKVEELKGFNEKLLNELSSLRNEVGKSAGTMSTRVVGIYNKLRTLEVRLYCHRQ